jgi:hypothetical protein
MPATLTRAKPRPIKTMKRLSLRSMLTRNMAALRPEFTGLNESDFKKEIVQRYKSEIVNCGLILVRLKLYREVRHKFDNLESQLKLVAGPLDIDFAPFKKVKRSVGDLFIPSSIIKLKPNTSIDQLETLFGGIYSAPDVSPGERRQLQNSVKTSFYECLALVDWCISLRFPGGHKDIFDRFLDENVLKYENLLRQLRQSHSPRIDKNEPERARLNRETFKRSYNNNTKHLWSKV